MNAILLAIVLTSSAPSFDVQTLDGGSLVGSIVAMTPERLTLNVGEVPTSVDMEQILTISAKKNPSEPHQTASSILIELTDGSTIHAMQYAVAGSQATIALAEGESVATPTSNVRTVALQQESGDLAAEWSRLIKRQVEGDLLVTRKDNSLDYHEGVLHDVTDDFVQFEVDGQRLPVKRSKIYGFAYRHASQPALPPAACRVTDAAGSCWSAQSFALAEKLEWRTPTGLALSAPIEQIAMIDFSSGKIVYLSDLKPDGIHWTPLFDTGKPLSALQQFYSPRYNRNHESAPLQLDGVQYPKGLALHCRTELVYRLADGFRRLRAVAGIDDAVRPAGRVRLAIHGDDRPLFDASIVGSESPRNIDLDIAGVRRLTILVDFDERAGRGGYLLLCNARLSK